METNLINFIPEQLFILVVGIYVLGIFLKQIPYVKDFLIPIMLMVFAIVFSCLLSKQLSPIAILQGILCWGVSIGANQTLKQIKKGE